jgi:hypothetical protein
VEHRTNIEHRPITRRRRLGSHRPHCGKCRYGVAPWQRSAGLQICQTYARGQKKQDSAIARISAGRCRHTCFLQKSVCVPNMANLDPEAQMNLPGSPVDSLIARPERRLSFLALHLHYGGRWHHVRVEMGHDPQ